jgi:thiol-disulfide isomerase/thioredoxin
MVFATGRWFHAGEPPTREVPKFQFKLLDGTTFRSKDLSGRIAVIDFWGTWCRPCIAEIPEYNAFYRDYRDKGVLLVAIAVESGKESAVRAAVQRLGMEYPAAAPSNTQLEPFVDVTVFPTTWIVKDGRIEKEFLGTPAGKHKELRETIDRLLAGK